MHWAVKAKEKQKWGDILLCMGVPERQRLFEAAKSKRRARMVITLHNARQYDRDNAFGACKVIVDAAKAAGLIYDDRPAYLDLEVQQEKSTRKAKRTVIVLEVLSWRCCDQS